MNFRVIIGNVNEANPKYFLSINGGVIYPIPFDSEDEAASFGQWLDKLDRTSRQIKTHIDKLNAFLNPNNLKAVQWFIKYWLEQLSMDEIVGSPQDQLDVFVNKLEIHCSKNRDDSGGSLPLKPRFKLK